MDSVADWSIVLNLRPSETVFQPISSRITLRIEGNGKRDSPPTEPIASIDGRCPTLSQYKKGTQCLLLVTFSRVDTAKKKILLWRERELVGNPSVCVDTAKKKILLRRERELVGNPSVCY